MLKARREKLFLSFLLCLVLPIFAQDEIDASRQELEKTREKLREVQEYLKNLEEEERSVLARIEGFEQKIYLTQKLIQELKKVQTLTEQEINSIKLSIRNTEAKIEKRTKDLAARLVTIYKYGRLFPLEVLLSARSMPDVYKRMVYLRIIAQDDQTAMQELNILKENLEVQKKNLSKKLAELTQLRAEREKERLSLKKSLDLETKLLKKVRTTKEEKRTMELELQEAAAKLEKLIAELERKRRERKLAIGTHPLEINKGRLPWPYRGNVVANFGSQVHPKYKTKTRNTGIDIECPRGSVISAIGAGRIVYADRFMGYGNLVIIDHGDGYYSLYSNLSEMFVSVGMNVEPGQRIGKVETNLHFELRKEGQPVDPLEWLAK
ncbi:MAG: peptidoglycan DD-metalloendopeptidase family protein [candidate division WOR-3 bacterium]